MDVDWDSFIMLPFNNINTSSLSDNEDNNIIINRNLDPSLSSYDNSVVVNTNLLPLLAEYSNNHLSFFIHSDNFLASSECMTLKDTHNHEINPAQISDVIARYQHFSDDILQDIKFFLDCKVAPITQLEILKKKYLQHVFHKQDVYNTIYKFCQNSNKRTDSVLFLDILFEKNVSRPMLEDIYSAF
ncbi:protein far1-related sequence 5-like [Gigaspora margarita]|uniref:Protein far1-related sequence 5-like n=1 Tax=Gigaspora margarita TaxID=4874 RepID=A0A8H4B4U8_GIGMA|nr:protein far1-related sequence 5-like [Gigaspora margarita]